MLTVFRKIPVFLGKENKKFQITKVASGARNREYFGVVEWLLNAGIILWCFEADGWSNTLPIRDECKSYNRK